MYCILIGVINNIIWMFYMSGALFSQKNRELIAPITHFLHKYCYWYFDFKIAHILSGLAICYLLILLLNREINIGLFIVGLILNIIWIIIYMIAYMN